ncbi:MAG: class I SAM-dependent methyltransferase [Betaproteobacteria bacterium]
MPGYVNVDKFGKPDVQWDLERRPWPWQDNSVDEVLLEHVLEHLGQAPADFIGIIQELYRVCRDGARVRIRVPHPRHDSFLTDPTHVRPIMPGTLELFSRRKNLEWQSGGIANTPLALHHGVDFEIEDSGYVLEEPWRSQIAAGTLSQEAAFDLVERQNNVALEIDITLRVIKG